MGTKQHTRPETQASHGLEETTRDAHEPALFCGHIVLVVRGVVQAGSGHHVHLGDGHEHPPVLGLNLPEQVQEQDDRCSEVLLEEVLHVGGSVGRWLQSENVLVTKSRVSK